MNIKKTVKKMTAVLTGATMIGATVMGAVAMDLGDFPAPIVQDGEWDGRIVIGANAGSTLDVAGATEIGAKLPELGKVPVSVGGGVISVEGGHSFDENGLNEELTADLTESDVEGLLDDSIRWDGGDYDVTEELAVGGVYVATYAPNSTKGEEEFESDPYMVLDTPGDVGYNYVFEEKINATDKSFESRPLDLKILGKSVKVTGVGDDEITIEASAEHFLEEGDSVTVDGKEVELVRVGSNSVLVSVDGETKAIADDGDDVEFENADYFKVQLDSMFYIEGADDNSATLTLGDELTETVKTNDPMTMFGEPDDDNEAEWLWNINVTGDDVLEVGDYIGAVQNIKRSKVEVEDPDEERPALAMGDALDFPNKYAAIEFVGFEDSTQEIYDDLRIKPTNTRFGNEGYMDAMEISTTADKSVLRIMDTDLLKKTERIYVAGDENNDVFVYDADKELIYNETAANFETNITFELELAKEKVQITPDEKAWNVSFENGEEFALNISNTALDKFGGTEDDAEAGDVLFETEPIGDDDKLYRTSYGVIIDDMESGMDSDDFRIAVPHEKQTPVVVVSGKDTSTSVGGSGDAYNYPVAPEAVMLLDTDAMSQIGSTPMVVVGGPNANTVAADLLGVEQGGEDVLDMFSPNKAMIRLFEEENAILVAGYEAKDTYAASLALANFPNNEDSFEGYSEVELTIPDTTVTSIVGAN